MLLSFKGVDNVLSCSAAGLNGRFAQEEFISTMPRWVGIFDLKPRQTPRCCLVGMSIGGAICTRTSKTIVDSLGRYWRFAGR